VRTVEKPRRRSLPGTWRGGERPLQAGSVEFLKCGEIHRDVQARVGELKLNELRVLTAVLSLTLSYSKLADATHLGRIADLAGLDRKRKKHTHSGTRRPQYPDTSYALRRLRAMGIVEWYPPRKKAEIGVVALPGWWEETAAF
jgi:hypothetical protein